MKKKPGTSADFALLPALLLLCDSALAGLCDTHRLEVTSMPTNPVASDYFDSFQIGKANGVYRIEAEKTVAASRAGLQKALGDLESHAEFLPGYQRIDVLRKDDGSAITAIRFELDIAWFESRFSNRVEFEHGAEAYLYCWRQLDEHDPEALEPYRHSPGKNQGFWQVQALSGGGVRLAYSALVQPPFPIPEFIYRRIAGATYQDVFAALIQRGNAVAGQ